MVALALSLAVAPPAASARVIGADEGDSAEQPNGFKAVHKVGELSTGSSQVFVAVGTIPPGMSTGRHLHEIDEEIIYVLEGELTVVLGDETATAGVGDTVFVPVATWMEVANRSEAPVRAVVIVPRAEAERCYRVLHGVEVEGMTETEMQEAVVLCHLQTAPPPAGAEE
jgi:uncharacterized RmlC-like cupin family protein